MKVKSKKTSKKPNEVWLVVTILHDSFGGGDTYSDIIGIFTSKKKAGEIYSKVVAKEPIKGLDYEMLYQYDDVSLISKELNTI